MSQWFSALSAVLTLFVALYAEGAGATIYNNQWDKPVLFDCPYGQVLSSVYSVHNNHKEDRRWRFTCKAAPFSANPTSCYWSDYANGWDAPLNFKCPGNYVIAGVSSYHDNRREDRLTRFKCCEQHGYVTYSCSLTSYMNAWDQVLDYTVPNGNVITGWYSVHDNHREDRRHKFLACNYGKLDGIQG